MTIAFAPFGPGLDSWFEWGVSLAWPLHPASWGPVGWLNGPWERPAPALGHAKTHSGRASSPGGRAGRAVATRTAGRTRRRAGSRTRRRLPGAGPRGFLLRRVLGAGLGAPWLVRLALDGDAPWLARLALPRVVKGAPVSYT